MQGRLAIMRDPSQPEHNELLGALHPAERARIYPYLQRVAMPLGMVLYEPSDVLRHVYFPTDCIVSLLYMMENGDSAEISVVGNEGLVGVALFMGGESTPSRAIVQSKGSAFRLTSRRLKDEFLPTGSSTVPAFAIYAKFTHADGADCRMQPAPFRGSAVMPLAVTLT